MTSLVDKTDITNRVEKLCLFIFFATLFFYLTLPVSDPDFWWHLASGKWIVQHGSLMHDDPFSIPYHFSGDPLRESVILNQYWLAQVFFYGVYLLGGFKGIIIMRSAVFALMFFLIYRLMRRNGASRALSVILVYIAVAVIVKEFQYIGDRPQLWTSFFSILVLLVLEDLLEKRKLAYAALPLLMLLWGNMHGGFLLGDAVIIIYLVSAVLGRSADKGFYLACGSSILLSFANPNGFSIVSSFLALFSPAYRQYVSSISETQSIFSHSSLEGIFRDLPYLSGLGLLTIVSLLPAIVRKKMRKEVFFLVLLAFVMGYKAIRFIPFFTCIASFTAAVNIQTFLDGPFCSKLYARFSGKLKPVFFSLFVAATVFFAWSFSSSASERSGLTSDFPFATGYQGAADFLLASGLKGNVFNDYNQGGYLIWRLSPEFKIAIDGRNLQNEVFSMYREVVDSPLLPLSRYDAVPVYKAFFDGFKINFVLISGCDAVSGFPIALVPVLSHDPAWALVYADRYALVFMRGTAINDYSLSTHRLPSSVAFDNMIAIAEDASHDHHARMMGEWKRSLAIAYYEKGEGEKALYWINEYLAQRPRSGPAIDLKLQIEQSLPGR